MTKTITLVVGCWLLAFSLNAQKALKPYGPVPTPAQVEWQRTRGW